MRLVEGLVIRPARAVELPALSALCLRSKAHGGYDDAFMASCVDELTLTAKDYETGWIAVAERDGQVIGMVQVVVEGEEADLYKLFVDPHAMGCGAGAALFRWAEAVARASGASFMTIEADPDAEPFYAHMGGVRVGEAASGSILGRVLPELRLELQA